MPTSDSTGRCVSRIADVLSCFTVEEPVHNLTEISKRVGLAKSTTHRLIATLLAEGFLMRDVHGRGYQLGYRMLQWGLVAQLGLNLRAEVLPILRSLSRALDETAILTVRSGAASMCLEIVESTQPVRLAMRVGQPLRLYAGASSKVLLAFLPEPEIEQVIGSLELVQLAPNTITSVERLRAELAAIRQRGYATSFEETDRGAMGIAGPVYDHHGQPIAGIGIAAPLSRITRERVPEVAALVLEASHQLSARLGAPAVQRAAEVEA